MPNTAFTLLITLAGLLAILTVDSVTSLLMMGAGGAGFDLYCLLIPSTSDLAVHLLTYGLLLLVLVGAATGWRALLGERNRTERFLRRYLVRRAGERGTLEGVADRVGLGGRIDLVDVDEPRCFCYGLVRPRVCVTTGLMALLDDAEQEAVLRHEAYHVRNYDPLKLTLGRALVSAFFFVPALRDLYEHYRLHVELLADKQAVRQMRQAQSLAAALDKLLDARAPGLPTLPDIAHGGSLALRIDSLLGDPVRVSIRMQPVRLVLSAVLVLLIAAPAVATPAIAQDRLLAALASAPHGPC